MVPLRPVVAAATSLTVVLLVAAAAWAEPPSRHSSPGAVQTSEQAPPGPVVEARDPRPWAEEDEAVGGPPVSAEPAAPAQPWQDREGEEGSKPGTSASTTRTPAQASLPAGRLEINVGSGEGLQILVDGAPQPVRSGIVALDVPAGEHSVILVPDHGPAVVLLVDVEPGERERVRMGLAGTARAAAPPAQPQRPPDAATDASDGPTATAYIVLALGTAALAVGVASTLTLASGGGDRAPGAWVAAEATTALGILGVGLGVSLMAPPPPAPPHQAGASAGHRRLWAPQLRVSGHF